MSGRLQRVTGLTYAERMMAPPIGFSNGPSWVHESPFLYRDGEEKSLFGASRLQDMAMKRTLFDQRSLTPELFANVPWHIANYLWECLGKSGKQTVYIWKVFATAYPVEFRKISHRRSMKIGFPMMSVQEYLGLVKDDALSWGVALFLSTIYARTPDLVGIAHIKNLVALEISTPSQPSLDSLGETVPSATLNDRIVKTWCELAQTSGALRYLRVLRIYSQDDLSTTIFQYLRSFPSLCMFIVQDCKGLTPESSKKFAERYGWEIGTRPQRELNDEEEVDMDESDTLYECYKEAWTLMDCEQKDKPALELDTPVLDFQVGIKRKLRNTQPVVFLKKRPIEPATTETVMRKRKLTVSGREAVSGSDTKAKKPVMKDRGKKDITGLLAEFF